MLYLKLIFLPNFHTYRSKFEHLFVQRRGSKESNLTGILLKMLFYTYTDHHLRYVCLLLCDLLFSVAFFYI